MEFDISLTASLEDYLETIYHIVAEKQAARGKDIALQTQGKQLFSYRSTEVII